MTRIASVSPTRTAPRSGMALLVVLVLIMLASFAAYGYMSSMQNQYRNVRVLEDQIHAKQAALSGIEVMAALLEQPYKHRADMSRISELSEQFQVHFVENESAKIHLPTLVVWDREQPGQARRILSSLPGANQPVVDAWLNKLGLQQPSVRVELRSSRNDGGEPQETSQSDGLNWLWYGQDLNHNGTIDPIEGLLRGDALEGRLDRDVERPSSIGQDGNAQIKPSWRNFLTWSGGCRNESFSGRRRVDLNQPDLQNLHRELLAIWPADWANFVVFYRQFGPTLKVSRTNETSSASNPPDFSIPASRTLRSPIELVGVNVVPLAPKIGGPKSSTKSRSVEPASVVSPFRREMIQASDYLSRLLDEVTTSEGEFVHGRIDITDAPVEVLMAIPGIERQLAERIVENRQSRSTGLVGDKLSNQTEHESAPSIAWLIEEGLVDLAQFVQLEPYLTARSDVYTCQIVGTAKESKVQYRCTATIDASAAPAIVRDFQTWHAWGRLNEQQIPQTDSKKRDY